MSADAPRIERTPTYIPPPRAKVSQNQGTNGSATLPAGVLSPQLIDLQGLAVEDMPVFVPSLRISNEQWDWMLTFPEHIRSSEFFIETITDLAGKMPLGSTTRDIVQTTVLHKEWERSLGNR